jgi:copper chaperone NosL
MRPWPAALLLLASCGGVPEPVQIDARGEACAWCRMAVSDLRTAAQLVAPLEEPRVFDDVGCLRDYLAGDAVLASGTVAYVADHRTGAWVLASRAVYAHSSALSTPMSSGLAAWTDAASRESDPSLPANVAPRTATEVFGPPGSRGGLP